MTKSTFSRRALVVLALSTFTLSACGGSSPIASSSDAFVVNGTAYPLDTFETLLADLVDNKQLEVAANGQPSKTDANDVMRTLIRYEAYKNYIDEYNLSEDPADRKKIEDEVAKNGGFGALPLYVQDLLINLNVAQLTIEKFEAFSEATLKKLYNESPASTGVMCMSHILLKTEKDAKKVLTELAEGGKFADLAKKYSIEPAAAQSGGSLASDDEQCSGLSTYQQQFDPVFMAGAVAAKAGVPTGPVKTQFGYHIILNHPYDEVKSSLKKVSANEPSVSNLVGYMTTADISVNATYGVWNGAMSTIE